MSSAEAAILTYAAAGNENVSGYIQLDDVRFDETVSPFVVSPGVIGVFNFDIVDLSLTVFGSNFDTHDLVINRFTIVDIASGPHPRIVNGGGELANNGSYRIMFYPDGFGGEPHDGDASLAYGPAGGELTYLPVSWVPTSAIPKRADAIVAETPLPAALPLFLAGAAGLHVMRRRRKSK